MLSMVIGGFFLKWHLFSIIKGTVQDCTVNDILLKDVKIANSSFTYSSKSNIFTCASNCLMARLCTSFNFEVNNGVCVLNYKNSSQVTLTPSPGVIFSDISDWPKSLAGPCSNHTCSKARRCVPLRNKKMKCIGLELTETIKGARTFRAMNREKPWEVADKKCLIKGGQLLSSFSWGEFDFLSRVLKHTKLTEFWIGAVRIDDDWQWADGSTVSDTYWTVGQPITNGDCAYLRIGAGLMAGNCSTERRFMCEV